MKNNTGLRYKYFVKGDKSISYNHLDNEFLRQLRSHPKVNKFLFQDKNITRIEQEYWWENEYSNNDSWKIWIVYDEYIERPIGYINTKIDSIIHRRCQTDYVISPEFDEAKYENKIIKWMINNSKNIEIDIHKIWMYVLSENIKKIETMNKFGFEIDGIVRDHICKNNIFKDVYLMSLIVS
jgi:hypothetical protein